MKKSRTCPLFWWLFILTIAIGNASGQTHVTTCELQENATNHVNAMVEVRSVIVEGAAHASFIRDGGCMFLFASGDDYQEFGNQFPAVQNAEWKRMQKILSKPKCGINLRLARATLRGTVIRVPATGTISPDEMGLELVIQSVVDVEPVPLKCDASSVSR